LQNNNKPIMGLKIRWRPKYRMVISEGRFWIKRTQKNKKDILKKCKTVANDEWFNYISLVYKDIEII